MNRSSFGIATSLLLAASSALASGNVGLTSGQIRTATPSDVGSADAEGTSLAMARADHVHKGVMLQGVTAGTQQSGNVNISGTVLAGRFALTTADSGATLLDLNAAAGTSTSFVNWVNNFASFRWFAGGTGGNSGIALGRSGSSNSGIYLYWGDDETNTSQQWRLGLDPSDDHLHLYDNANHEFLRGFQGAAGTGYLSFVSPLNFGVSGNCQPTTDADICIAGVRNNKTQIRVDSPNGFSGDFINFRIFGSATLQGRLDSSGNWYSNTLDAVGAANLNVGASNATSITLGKAGTANGNGVRTAASRTIIANKPTTPIDCGATNLTPTVTQILEAAIFTCATTQTITLPTMQGATGLIQALPGTKAIGDVFEFLLASSANTFTLVAGTGATLYGTIAASTGTRLVWCRVTSVTANTETATCY